MKKLLTKLILLALPFSTISIVQANTFGGEGMLSGDLTVRGDVAAYNRYKKIEEPNGTESMTGKAKNTGLALAVEYMYDISDVTKFGVGLAYQFNPKAKGVRDATGAGWQDARLFDSIPLYVTGKYSIPIDSDWGLYLKANVGYSFNLDKDDIKYISGFNGNEINYDLKVDDGFYGAAGIGAEFGNFGVDLMYQYNSAKAKFSPGGIEQKSNVDYSRITVGLNYTF